MANNQENTKRVAKNTLFLFFRMVLVLCVGLYTSRVVLNTLGVEDYGIYNLVGSVVVLFSFLQQALTNATYRYLAYEQGKNDMKRLKRTFSMAVNAHVILATVILFLCEIGGVWFLNNKLVVPEGRIFAANVAFQFSMLCFCINIIKTPYNSSIIAHERMNFYAYTSIVEVVLKLAIVYILVIFDFDKLILYSFLIFCIGLFMFGWYWIQCKRLFEECTYTKCWDSGMIKGMMNYSGWSVIVNAVDVSVNQSILFFFNIFFGVVANAAMGVANQVNSHLSNFLSSFTQSFNPQIIKSYASGDKDYFMKLIFSTSKLSYYMLLFASVPILLNIDFILDLWLKTPPEGTSTFIILVIGYSLVDAYSAPLWIGVHATGKLRTHQLLMSSIKILNIPIAYFLLKCGLPAWTALGLKMGLNIVCSIVRPCYVKSLYGLPLRQYLKQVWVVVYLVTALLLPLPIYVASLFEPSWNRLLMSSSIYVLLFIPIVYFIGLNGIERNLLKKMILNKIIKRHN